MRPCPRCTFPMRVLTHRSTEVDHCDRCGGNFLEVGEAGATYGQELEPARWRDSESAVRLGTSALRCPVDRQPMTAYRVAADSHGVEVDLCEACGGMWLDAHEGKALRRAGRAARRAEQAAAGTLPTPGVGSYFFQLLTAMPIEVWNPVRRRPVLVYGLVGLLTALFLGELIYLSTLTEAAAFEALCAVGLVPAEVLEGRHLWTLVTHAFFHGDWLHLAGNLYFLWIFGDNVEATLGRGRFALGFVAAAVAGGVLQALLQSDPAIPLIGASGAIAGLMGAYLVLFPRVKVWIVFFFVRFKLSVWIYLGLWVGFNLVMGAADSPGVGWFAHIGGFAAGVGLGLWLRSAVAVETAPEPTRPAGA